MSKISFFLRLPNKIGAQGLTVKHAHGDGAPFTKSTGVSLPERYFDLDKGRVKDTVPNAADLNEQIHRVHNTVLKALGYCNQYGVEPTRAVMEEWYDKVTTMRQQLQDAQPKVKRIKKVIVEGLREEVANLEAELVRKKAELLEAELATGEYREHLLLHFFERYALEKEELAENTHKIFRNVADRITAFRPTWEIAQVTPESLKEFEKWLYKFRHGKPDKEGKQKVGYTRITVLETLSKLKTVIYEYAQELKLDVQALRDHSPTLKRKRSNSNVVFLTTAEVQALLDLDLKLDPPLWAQVRDRFCIMALTGVRYSDSDIKRKHVQNKNLVLATTKNDEDILVPLSEKVLEILERDDYNFPDQSSSNFNVILEKICMNVPSLCETIEVKRYTGSKTPVKTEVPKYKKITSHVGRKSLINNALIGGVPAPAIASIVGHQGVNLVLSTYGSGAAGRDKIRTLYELPDSK
ncbi:MAG: hypothetical protein EOO61_01765 [Hymenobacter sp.]|nr:MAG: hypothetical protein EOO61_01765 [Hymenobacter sp.]